MPMSYFPGVEHVTDIKYKGVHPLEKKKVIKDINLLIDKFNSDNNLLYEDSVRYNDDETNKKYYKDKKSNKIPNIYATISNIVISEFSYHRNYLLAYLHDIKFESTTLEERLRYNRVSEFEKFISSITQNPKLSLKDITQCIFNWYRCEKTFLLGEKAKIVVGIEKLAKIYTEKIKNEIKAKQESKRKKLLKHCQEWVKFIDTTTKEKKEKLKSNESIFLSSAIKELISIVSRKKGDLSQCSFETIKKCFFRNRNWKPILPASQYTDKYPPLPKSDSRTNQILINLYALITDDGIKDQIRQKIILPYITKK